MDFDDVLAQTLYLLQRQGKVSYSALRRRFDLDDAYLNDLKDELLFAHPVVDEQDRGLVWTGETASISVATSQPDQSDPQPVVEPAQLAQATSSPVAPHTPEAERRQLTVMFVDLVGSTRLSGELDPEELRDVVRAYQSTCTEVVHRYDGYVAQLLGDGLLVYFGFPQAHEDDAQRAVRAGLDIVEAIGALNTRLEQDQGITLAVRLGIHTGLVVVGDMGGSGRQEPLALGETPNLAARLQGLAEPDTVVISAHTYRLIQGYFDCDSLGEYELRGVSQPIVVYRVLRASGVQSRLDIARTHGLTPLVGREQEAGLLIERWSRVKEGQGQVVLLSGEAGIGKSRMVQVLKDHIVEEAHTRVECRSLPYFTNSALYPMTDFLQRTWRFQTDDTPEQKLEKLRQSLSPYRLPLEESVPLFASLLSLPVPEDQYPPLTLPPQRQRQKTLESMVAIVLELAESQPVLFILEDLHWTDPTTLEFIDLLIHQTPTACVYALLTCRPEYQPSWSHHSYLTEVTLNRLSQSQSERMIEGVTGGKPLTSEVRQQIVERSDGVALFIEEMTKSTLESGYLKEVDGHYELTGPMGSLTVPATLQDSLMARLDRLVAAKAVAQYAAVIGRQFTYELLHAVSPLTAAMLQYELGRLVAAELVYQRGLPPQATYTFKHALIQDTAYESLLKSTRQQYHQRIVQVVEVQFPDIAETQPELLAHHYTEAGLTEPAVIWWQRAGETAFQKSAITEAIGHLTQGVDLLNTLADSPQRMQRELDMQILLGKSLAIAQTASAPEAQRAYTRARVLCDRLGNTHQLYDVLVGFARYYQDQGKYQHLLEINEQLLALAQDQHDTMRLVEAHNMLGQNLRRLDDLATARYHLEQAIHLYDTHVPPPSTGNAVGSSYLLMSSLFHYAIVLWNLGYPDAILACIEQMRKWARGTPFDQAWFLWFSADLHTLRGEWDTAHEQLDLLMPLATEHSIAMPRILGMYRLGYVLAREGQGEAGVALIRQALASHLGKKGLTGSIALHALARTYAHLRQPEDGLRAVAEAFDLLLETGERQQEFQLYRLKGELLLMQQSSDPIQAEACFQQALAIARSQRAKSLELLAAMRLARLWQQQGKHAEAYELLAPIYGWFTEGFDTSDLKDAKVLLDELGG